MLDYAAAIADARARYRPDPPSLRVLDDRFNFLAGTGGNVTSQCGEDGVIAALFGRLGARNCRCFEVGAHDGLFLSNTKALRDAGWQALLMESDRDRFSACMKNAPEARVIGGHVGPDDLDRLLALAGFPHDLDLGVIDVDGDDLRLWAGLRVFRPRVMLVEFNRNGDGPILGPGTFQAGLWSLCRLAKVKGYLPAAETGHNAFFVDEGCS